MTIQHRETIPTQIEVEGARVNNLKNINVEIPLNAFVAITGVSGSGKSSLAMGVLYAEGARRYLDALATYTRRRIAQVGRADVTAVRYLPSAIALRQRPSVPGVRSTVGTATESLNVLRLMFSRIASLRCPNGHQLPPTTAVAASGDDPATMGQITCPVCGVKFIAPGAEDFAFNSAGACPTCGGTGELRQIKTDLLIPDDSKTIREGAVAAWRLPGRGLVMYSGEQMGLRLDVPYRDLTAKEKELVLHGPSVKNEVIVPSSTGKTFKMQAMYENAFAAVESSLAKTKNERAIKRLNRFYSFDVCPTCHGSRFNPKLLTSLILDQNIAQVSDLTIGDLVQFAKKIPAWLPEDVRKMGQNLVTELLATLQPLVDLGLDYLTLARAGNTLSTGELQRIQLGRTLRSNTTGVLYVLDEPSVGLHPANVEGLIKILRQLVAQGNSLVVVDHDTAIIGAADYVLEIGPGAGSRGGQVIHQGTVEQVEHSADSLIGPFLTGQAQLISRPRIATKDIFAKGTLEISISHLFNLNDVDARFAKNRLNVVTGFSGAGKTSLVLDSLIPAIHAQLHHESMPKQVTDLKRAAINAVQVVDSVPVGKNVRSTVATYTKIMDQIRALYAETEGAKKAGYTASDFSYNNQGGACPNCGGTGTISLDIQYLPDMMEICPVCHGRRYNPEILKVTWQNQSIADLLALSVEDAIPVFKDEEVIEEILLNLQSMGLGYLILGESTPALSGGEAQRLKLVSRIGRSQKNRLFVFDEPSVGLHPQDIQTLIQVFDQLLSQGATIIVIEHDLDVIANADWVIDMGPKGGIEGGHVIATGTPEDVAKVNKSITGTFLKRHFDLYK